MDARRFETMKKTFNFGKIDGYGNGRKTCEVTIDVELRETEKGKEFSACGNVWNHLHTDIIMGGQCLDSIAKYVKNDTFKLIYKMWEKYHLNGMHAGTHAQEEALEEAVKSGKLERYGANNYTETCDYLKSIGLYEVEYNGKPYKYGHGWLFWEIPEEDLKQIEKLLAQ